MRLSPAQASMLARLYTAGGVMRQEVLCSDHGDWHTLRALIRRFLVELFHGLVCMTPDAWALYPPEAQIENAAHSGRRERGRA